MKYQCRRGARGSTIGLSMASSGVRLRQQEQPQARERNDHEQHPALREPGEARVLVDGNRLVVGEHKSGDVAGDEYADLDVPNSRRADHTEVDRARARPARIPAMAERVREQIRELGLLLED